LAQFWTGEGKFEWAIGGGGLEIKEEKEKKTSKKEEKANLLSPLSRSTTSLTFRLALSVFLTPITVLAKGA